MTTTQPAALPELPEPFALSLSIHDGENCKWPLIECKLLQKHPAEKQHLYTADQMRAYALAALQPKPAEVSDAEIIAIKKATRAADPTQPWGDTLAFARALLALRPAQQATPEPEWETSPPDGETWETSPMDGEQWETSPMAKATPEPVPSYAVKAHAQIEHLLNDLTDEEVHDGLTFYVVKRDLRTNNLIGALKRLHAEHPTATPEPVGEPIYQHQLADGSWIDQTKQSYDYNVKHGHSALLRVLYTHPTPAPQQVPMTDEQRAVLRFLLGDGLLDGRAFGDIHPDTAGRFWWRADMCKAFPGLSVSHGITAQAKGGPK